MAVGVNITLNIRSGFGVPSANCSENDPEIIDRFWSLVRRGAPESCWTFIRLGTRGYGVFVVGRARVRAHRFAWMLAHGAIPIGKVVCHNCDTPACVNPYHLRLDTQAGNIRESIQKGRKRSWGRQTLRAEQVRAIRRLYASGEVTQRALASRYGIARNTVSQIIAGKTWGHVSEPTHV